MNNIQQDVCAECLEYVYRCVCMHGYVQGLYGYGHIRRCYTWTQIPILLIHINDMYMFIHTFQCSGANPGDSSSSYCKKQSELSFTSISASLYTAGVGTEIPPPMLAELFLNIMLEPENSWTYHNSQVIKCIACIKEILYFKSKIIYNL